VDQKSCGTPGTTSYVALGTRAASWAGGHSGRLPQALQVRNRAPEGVWAAAGPTDAARLGVPGSMTGRRQPIVLPGVARPRNVIRIEGNRPQIV
jgi:hypothetical protein